MDQERGTPSAQRHEGNGHGAIGEDGHRRHGAGRLCVVGISRVGRRGNDHHSVSLIPPPCHAAASPPANACYAMKHIH